MATTLGELALALSAMTATSSGEGATTAFRVADAVEDSEEAAMFSAPKEDLPEGWLPDDPFQWTDNRPVGCPVCGWRGREEDLVDAEHEILDAIVPGEITPVGRCPDTRCGATVFYADVQIAWRPAPSLLEQIAEAARDDSERRDGRSTSASPAP